MGSPSPSWASWKSVAPRGGGNQEAELRAAFLGPDPCALLDQTFPILGPIEIHREKGKPRQDSFTFEAPEAGAVCLVLVNGRSGPPHGERISAAWIELDDQPLVEPDAFSQQVEGFGRSFEVTAGPHALGVRLASGPEGFLTVELRFLGQDLVAPTLSFDPADGSMLTTDLPLLRVGYEDARSGVDPATLVVVLNGQDVTGQFARGPGEAVWQVGVDAYLPEGQNTLQVKVADRAGNAAEASATFEDHVATEELLADLESEDALFRKRSAAKLIEREGEISVEVLRQSLRQLFATPEPRAVGGLLAIARPGRGDFLARSLAVSTIGETARADPVTSARADVVAGLGAMLLEDRAPGVKALAARALGLTQNPEALPILDEVLESGPRNPALPESCEFVYEPLCDEWLAITVLTAFPAMKAAIRIAGHGHLVGNPGDIMVIWRKYRAEAEALLAGGREGGAP